jgi:hypothetical protein
VIERLRKACAFAEGCTPEDFFKIIWVTKAHAGRNSSKTPTSS